MGFGILFIGYLFFFNLFYCFQNNTNYDDNRCTSKGYLCTEYTIKEEWKNYYDAKTCRTNKDDTVQDVC